MNCLQLQPKTSGLYEQRDGVAMGSLLPGIVNRTQSNYGKFQSNEIELTEKKKKTIERSIFELVICVKQALKIPNQLLQKIRR